MVKMNIPPKALSTKSFVTMIAAMLMVLGMVLSAPALAQTETNDSLSGLPLPRFVSLRSQPINVRVGPGTRYEIAWVFVKPSLPVEIIQEFDIWRKIRDIDGQEGWIHQNLLVGRRTAYVAPWSQTEDPIAMRTRAEETATIRALLGPNVLVNVESCDGSTCKIATRTDDGADRAYSGFIDQENLWGVYANEEFD